MAIVAIVVEVRERMKIFAATLIKAKLIPSGFATKAAVLSFMWINRVPVAIVSAQVVITAPPALTVIAKMVTNVKGLIDAGLQKGMIFIIMTITALMVNANTLGNTFKVAVVVLLTQMEERIMK